MKPCVRWGEGFLPIPRSSLSLASRLPAADMCTVPPPREGSADQSGRVPPGLQGQAKGLKNDFAKNSILSYLHRKK